MAKTRVDVRDMRSLERRSMYEIFAPLDPNERLPRELIEDGPPPLGVALLPRRYRKLARKEIAVAAFFPAIFLLLTIAGLTRLDGWTTFGTAVLLVIGLTAFAKSGKR